MFSNSFVTMVSFTVSPFEHAVDRVYLNFHKCVNASFKVFHQADSSGRPMMDLGHVVTALNKLDTRDEEKIVLASRDGKSILVVSFADVGNCLENAYAELCANSVNANMPYQGNVLHSQQYR